MGTLSINRSKRIDRLKHVVYMFLFLVAAYVVLLTQWDYLRAIEENDIFLSSHTFMVQTLAKQGGLWAWIGSFLCQFFHYPWLGALLLVGIWGAIFAVLVSAFRLKGLWQLAAWIPVASLLVSVTDIGYWIYYIQMPGYWFSQSVSFLAAALIAWIASRLAAFVLKEKKDGVWHSAIASAAFVIASFVIGQKFPEFRRGDYENHLLQIPFYVAPISTALLPLTKLVKINWQWKWKTEAVTLLALAAFSVAAYQLSFRNPDFHAELRMMQATDECRWNDVIEEAKAARRPTNMMVVYKNIALMHTGHLTDMFKINNCGCQPQTGDSLRVNISVIGGPDIYYQFGQTNYAYRWAMEGSVQYGLRLRYVKMMARCAIMNHEFDVAAKYIAIIKSTLFGKQWAKEREPMLRHADALTASEEYKNISPLLMDDVNYLDIDESLPEKWILDHFSDLRKANNDKLEDVIMCVSLWTEDEYSFLIHFYEYSKNHPRESVPELYQQAAILLSKSEQSPINVDNFPFDEMVRQRYDRFCDEYASLANMGLDNDAMGARMKKAFGDTFWWYYYFYTDFHIY